MFLNVFGCFWVLLGVFGVFKCFCLLGVLSIIGCFRAFLGVFGCFGGVSGCFGVL